MALKKHPTMAAMLTPFPYHIEGSAPLAEAKQLMTDKHIHHLIVMENDDIAGMLSDRDLQHHAVLYGVENDADLVVSDISSSNIIVADINDPLAKVLEAMAEKHLGSVVILREGELAGIFTTTDACKNFAHFLNDLFSADDTPNIVA